MPRSIGDFMFKLNLRTRSRDPKQTALSNDADIDEVCFSSDNQSLDMILMGCDGIWDGTVASKDHEFDT